MSSPKASLAATLVALSILAASAVARPAPDAECAEAIPPVGAQKIFDGLATAKPGDGCTLENVVTDLSQMKIGWKKDGKLQEAILVAPASCADAGAARGKMTTTVPSAVEAACPAAAALTRKVVDAGAPDALVKIVAGTHDGDARAPSTRRRPLGLIGAGLAAVIAVGAGIVALLRKRRGARASAAPTAKDEGAANERKADEAAPPPQAG